MVKWIAGQRPRAKFRPHQCPSCGFFDPHNRWCMNIQNRFSKPGGPLVGETKRDCRDFAKRLELFSEEL